MARVQKYLVEEQRWLLYVFASKNQWWALIYVIPLLILWFGIWAGSEMKFSHTVLGVGLGLIVWMSFEYFVHRVIYHYNPTSNSLWAKFLRSFHLYHHQVPEDRGVLTNGLVPAVLWTSTFGAVFYYLLPSIEMFAATMFTLNLYHYYYECIHQLVHAKTWKSGHLAYLQRYHLRHHLNWKVNFGQTTSLMDRFFGTYEAVSAESRLSLKHIFSNQPKSIAFDGREVSHD